MTQRQRSIAIGTDDDARVIWVSENQGRLCLRSGTARIRLTRAELLRVFDAAAQLLTKETTDA